MKERLERLARSPHLSASLLSQVFPKSLQDKTEHNVQQRKLKQISGSSCFMLAGMESIRNILVQIGKETSNYFFDRFYKKIAVGKDTM